MARSCCFVVSRSRLCNREPEFKLNHYQMLCIIHEFFDGDSSVTPEPGATPFGSLCFRAIQCFLELVVDFGGKIMKRLLFATACLVICVGLCQAQKKKADADYYPQGYSGETWTGEVTAVDNDKRKLTLTDTKGKEVSTFIATIPDAPYEWQRDARNFRVVDFPFDKKATVQTFKYVGKGEGAGVLIPDVMGVGIKKRPNPPVTNVMSDFSELKGRDITVDYTPRERGAGNQKEKYNDVWRIRILPAKK